MLYLIFSRKSPRHNFYRVDFKTSLNGESERSERAPFPKLMSDLLDELDRRRDPVEPHYERDVPPEEIGLIDRILALYNEATKPAFPGK